MFLEKDEFMESCKVQLTDAERQQKGGELARLLQEGGKLESDMKEAVAQFKAQIETTRAAATTLSVTLNNGYEWRPVVCRQVMNRPEVGDKTVVRTDTGEVVRTGPMTTDDGQTVLDGML